MIRAISTWNRDGIEMAHGIKVHAQEKRGREGMKSIVRDENKKSSKLQTKQFPNVAEIIFGYTTMRVKHTEFGNHKVKQYSSTHRCVDTHRLINT
jgi:hypothetical protein